jgi:hypothetical protein
LENTSSTKTETKSEKVIRILSAIKGSIKHFLDHKLRPSTAESIGWIGLVVLQGALIPTYLAIMADVTDKMPPLDLVLFIWAALILRDTVNILTIGAGFIVNAVFLALILFK